MAAKPLPDAQHLRECFEYDPETGIVKWRFRPRHHFISKRSYRVWNVRFSDTECGRPTTDRYLYVVVDSTRYMLHRIIWKIVTGEDPKHLIDHVDMDTDNNRWANLRAATQAENLRNRKKPKGLDYTSITKGVSSDKAGRWRAHVTFETRQIYLGTFDTEIEARAAYMAGARLMHGKFFNPGWTPIETS